MPRPIVPILVACLMAVAIAPAEADGKKVRVPDRFDGAWVITAVTKEGPCTASTSYQVRIKASDASIPDPEIDIDGGVSASGAVRATITKGSNRVPITGNLDPKGSGEGTWHASGGLATCSGNWSARRAG